MYENNLTVWNLAQEFSTVFVPSSCCSRDPHRQLSRDLSLEKKKFETASSTSLKPGVFRLVRTNSCSSLLTHHNHIFMFVLPTNQRVQLLLLVLVSPILLGGL